MMVVGPLERGTRNQLEASIFSEDSWSMSAFQERPAAMAMEAEGLFTQISCPVSREQPQKVWGREGFRIPSSFLSEMSACIEFEI